jgi:hypothetical protein
MQTLPAHASLHPGYSDLPPPPEKDFRLLQRRLNVQPPFSGPTIFQHNRQNRRPFTGQANFHLLHRAELAATEDVVASNRQAIFPL